MTNPIFGSYLPIAALPEERTAHLSGRCLAVSFVAQGIIMTSGLVATNSSNEIISFIGYGTCILTTVLIVLTIFEAMEMMASRFRA